jgi:hypothetical protein
MSYPKKKKPTKWGPAHTVAHSHLKGKARWQVHVRATGRSRYLSHLVWEKMHGRPVRKGYVIHHRNEKPLDNRPVNLEEMTHAAHNSLHKLRRMKSHFRRKGVECKKCKLCGRILPVEMFPLNGRSAAGTPVRRPICSDCNKRRQQGDRAKRKNRRRHRK